MGLTSRTLVVRAGPAGGRGGGARVHLRAARGPRRAPVHQGVAPQVPHLHAPLRLRPLPAPPQDHAHLCGQYSSGETNLSQPCFSNPP